MTKSTSITEQKVKEQIKSVEQQYEKTQAEINEINQKGEALAKLLNVKIQEGLNLKGQYKALVELLPPKSRPKQQLTAKPKGKKK